MVEIELNMKMLESRRNMMERDGAEKEPRLSNVSYATICNNFRGNPFIFIYVEIKYSRDGANYEHA